MVHKSQFVVKYRADGLLGPSIGAAIQRKLTNEERTALFETYPDRVLRSTFPILILRGESIQTIGTGNALRLGSDLYALTAAHVASDCTEENPFYLPIPGRNYLKQLRAPWSRSAPLVGGRDDWDDLAACLMGDADDPDFAHLHPITIRDISTDRQPEAPYFIMSGYPSVTTTPGTAGLTPPKIQRMSIVANICERAPAGLAKYDPSLHLLFDADREIMINPDGTPMTFNAYTGYPVDYPNDLKGISGVGVWSHGDFNGPSDEWRDLEPKLVGIQIATYKTSGIIKATRIGLMTALLRARYPEAGRVLDLYLRR